MFVEILKFFAIVCLNLWLLVENRDFFRDRLPKFAFSSIVCQNAQFFRDRLLKIRDFFLRLKKFAIFLPRSFEEIRFFSRDRLKKFAISFRDRLKKFAIFFRDRLPKCGFFPPKFRLPKFAIFFFFQRLFAEIRDFFFREIFKEISNYISQRFTKFATYLCPCSRKIEIFYPQLIDESFLFFSATKSRNSRYIFHEWLKNFAIFLMTGWQNSLFPQSINFTVSFYDVVAKFCRVLSRLFDKNSGFILGSFDEIRSIISRSFGINLVYFAIVW